MNLNSAKTNGMDFLKKLRRIGAFFERENDVINRFGCAAVTGRKASKRRGNLPIVRAERAVLFPVVWTVKAKPASGLE